LGRGAALTWPAAIPPAAGHISFSERLAKVDIGLESGMSRPMPGRRAARSELEVTMGQRNEGEGNKTAAREYNRETTEFTKSGEVEGKAREAKQAMQGGEADEMRKAEREGKSHSHGEDRLLKGGAHKGA
jgi:hypothetical protein